MPDALAGSLVSIWDSPVRERSVKPLAKETTQPGAFAYGYQLTSPLVLASQRQHQTQALLPQGLCSPPATTAWLHCGDNGIPPLPLTCLPGATGG